MPETNNHPKSSFVKFVNGECRFFPEDIYQVNLDISRNVLTIIHIPSNTVSLMSEASKVLYVRYHLVTKQAEDTNN